MQSQIIRQTARLARTVPRSLTARRTYAQQAPELHDRAPKAEGPSEGRSNRIPQIVAISLVAAIPTFYIIQATIGTGDKSPGSGQAEIKKARREGDPSKEYRDPRDSGKKTTEADRPK